MLIKQTLASNFGGTHQLREEIDGTHQLRDYRESGSMKSISHQSRPGAALPDPLVCPLCTETVLVRRALYYYIL